MKNLSIKIIFLAVFAFIIFFGGSALVNSTGDDKFCTLCHKWMNPMVTAYHNDVHGGASKYGFKAKCVDCHLPHDSYIGYVFKKASNGISEVTHMMTHDAKNQPWIENRKNRANFVYDSGCLSCHKTILDKNSSNANITDMHALYSKFKDDVKNKLDCVSCHKNVGHNNLGKTLYEIKHPPVGNW
jgi:napC/nirT cytoChrome c family, N-region